MANNIGAASHPIQAQLRIDPDKTFEKYDFVVDNSVYTQGTIGGACQLTCSDAGSQIYRLNAAQGSGDWFFPYINSSDGGVGMCEVPANQANGTIVATGPMNGCLLQVNRANDRLFFYHDLNGKNMKGKLVPGEVVALIEYEKYAGVENMGYNLASNYSGSHSTSGAIHEYFLVTVRVGNLWKTFCSSILKIQTSGNAISYQAFRPRRQKLVNIFQA